MYKPISLMRPTIRLLLLLFALATAGCDQGAAPAPSDPRPGITTPPVEPGVMPGAIGTLWIYRVRYPSAIHDDTIQVRVVDTVRTAARMMVLDHIILLDEPIGKRWESSSSDSTEITGSVSIDVPAGHYDDVIAMTRTLTTGLTSELWLKPHVGFIRMTEPLFKSRVPGEQWTLIRFLP
jgi:hypothetical protein